MLLTPCEQFLVQTWHHILPHAICPAPCALETVFSALLFRPYLYLLDCRRCCLPCLAEASDTGPISKRLAKDLLGLIADTLRELSYM